MKKLLKITLSIVLICCTILSTIGVVFFHHFCQNAKQDYISIYVDNTKELCQEHSSCDSCCHSEKSEEANKGCCNDHKVQTFSYKLRDIFPERKIVNLPYYHLHFSILNIRKITESILLIDNSNQKIASSTPHLLSISPELNYGRTVTIRLQKLKLYC